MTALRSPLDLIGVRYVIGADTPARGFDCYTLLTFVRWHFYQRATPVNVPARALSPGLACALGIRRALSIRDGSLVSAWERCEAAEGVAVALGRSRLGRLHHCAVCVGEGVLHALEGAGVVWTPRDRLALLYGRVEFYECRD